MNVLRSLTRIRGHAISTWGLSSRSVVVDAGAHRGEFSRSLIAQFGCKCYLIEANPLLVEELCRENIFSGVLSAALAGADGRARFFSRQNSEASGIIPTALPSVAEADVSVVSLEALMKHFKLDHIDVLKLDIEGSEFDLLEKTPESALADLEQVCVEFHDFMPEFQGRGLYARAKRRLERLGFACCSTAFRTHGDVLFLNRRKFEIGPIASIGLPISARWYLRLASRNRHRYMRNG